MRRRGHRWLKNGRYPRTAKPGWGTAPAARRVNPMGSRGNRRTLPGAHHARAENHHRGRTEAKFCRRGSTQQKGPSMLARGTSASQRGQTPLRGKRKAEPDAAPLPFCSYAPALALHGRGGQRCQSHEGLWPTDPKSGSGSCLGRLGVLTTLASGAFQKQMPSLAGDRAIRWPALPGRSARGARTRPSFHSDSESERKLAPQLTAAPPPSAAPPPLQQAKERLDAF